EWYWINFSTIVATLAGLLTGLCVGPETDPWVGIGAGMATTVLVALLWAYLGALCTWLMGQSQDSFPVVDELEEMPGRELGPQLDGLPALQDCPPEEPEN